jgi:hypothetical protein
LAALFPNGDKRHEKGVYVTPKRPGGHELRERTEARIQAEANESIAALHQREQFAYQVGPQFYQAQGLVPPACIRPHHYTLGGDEHLDLAGLADGLAARADALARRVRTEGPFSGDPRVLLISLQRLASELHGTWALLNPPGYSPASGSFHTGKAPLRDSSEAGIPPGVMNPGPVLGPGSPGQPMPESPAVRQADQAVRQIDRSAAANPAENAVDYQVGLKIVATLSDIVAMARSIESAPRSGRILGTALGRVQMTVHNTFERLGSLGLLL